VLAHRLRALELDDALASPSLQHQFGCDPADVSGGTIGMALSRLQEGRDDALGPGLGNVPAQVFHETGGPQERDGNGSVERGFFHQVRWVSRFDCLAWAPMERKTTLAGRARRRLTRENDGLGSESRFTESKSSVSRPKDADVRERGFPEAKASSRCPSSALATRPAQVVFSPPSVPRPSSRIY